MTTHEFDQAIDALARKQHGAFSHSQAKRCGGTDSVIRYRRANGRWLTLDTGVYVLSGSTPTWLRQAKAAELSVPGSALSGRSAAALHGIEGFRRAAIELSAARGARRSSRLAVIRHRRPVPVTRVGGIAVTTLEQTLLDLAASSSRQQAGAAFDELLVARRVTVAAVQTLCREASRSRDAGAAVLGALVAERSADAYVPPTNALERVLYAVLDDPTLPAYSCQAQAWWVGATNCVDAVIPAWRRVVEADGRRWHTRRADFERDRRRDHSAQMNGFEVTRFSYHQLTDDPGYPLEVLRTIGRLEAA